MLTTSLHSLSLREQIGDVLREIRRSQGRTLRQVSADAQVSLGYLSEVERGQKEASSELLIAICYALGVPLSFVLREVADRLAAIEGVAIPDSVPADLVDLPFDDGVTLLS
ncbi:MAG: helix-turn-helix transcriptional regulator [Actinomycetaceae bacterium]|nr:helix-turn-helix transcriptional regulator [Actinomycetaceae bacterium]